MSQPTPDERLADCLAHLPPDALRSLEGSLERAQARARITGACVRVPVEFEVGPQGLVAVEITARFERRT